MLKDKMFISGDIYTQECEDAVGFVNQYLKKAIEVPARCNFNRLYEIVKTIDISEEEKLYLMENAYLGKINLTYKESIAEQIYELIDIRHQFPVRDIDWFHAIDDFNTNPDALKRYYPLFRMKFNLYTSAEDIAKAIFFE